MAEKFAPSLESLSSLGFAERNLGCPGNFAGMSRTPGVLKNFVQLKFVRAFRSLMEAPFFFVLSPLLVQESRGTDRDRTSSFSI